jgi:hypothetical protein
MGETEEKSKTWTIREMPPESRKKALAAANRRGETVARLMVRAIDLIVASDAGDRIEMPSEKASPESRGRPGLSIAELRALTEAMQSAAAYAAATGIKPAIRDGRRLHAALDAVVREGMGQPPRPVRLPRGQPIVDPPREATLFERKDLPRLRDVAS